MNANKQFKKNTLALNIYFIVSYICLHFCFFFFHDYDLIVLWFAFSSLLCSVVVVFLNCWARVFRCAFVGVVRPSRPSVLCVNDNNNDDEIETTFNKFKNKIENIPARPQLCGFLLYKDKLRTNWRQAKNMFLRERERAGTCYGFLLWIALFCIVVLCFAFRCCALLCIALLCFALPCFGLLCFDLHCSAYHSFAL